MGFLADHLPQLQLLAMLVNIILVLVIVPLRKSISDLDDRVRHLELDIARNYVQRNEVHDGFAEITRKLERIESALITRIARVESNNEG